MATTVAPPVGAFESRLLRSLVAFMRARLPASNGAVLGWKDGAVLHLDVVGDRSFVGGVLGSERVVNKQYVSIEAFISWHLFSSIPHRAHVKHLKSLL